MISEARCRALLAPAARDGACEDVRYAKLAAISDAPQPSSWLRATSAHIRCHASKVIRRDVERVRYPVSQRPLPRAGSVAPLRNSPCGNNRRPRRSRRHEPLGRSPRSRLRTASSPPSLRRISATLGDRFSSSRSLTFTRVAHARVGPRIDGRELDVVVLEVRAILQKLALRRALEDHAADVSNRESAAGAAASSARALR